MPHIVRRMRFRLGQLRNSWEEAQVALIIRRYVERNALTKATIERLNKAEG